MKPWEKERNKNRRLTEHGENPETAADALRKKNRPEPPGTIEAGLYSGSLDDFMKVGNNYGDEAKKLTTVEEPPCYKTKEEQLHSMADVARFWHGMNINF
jgi:hypothetical protein